MYSKINSAALPNSICILIVFLLGCVPEQQIEVYPLHHDDYKHYIDTFNNNDNELYVQHIPNDSVWKFLKANIPLVDLPDKVIEETYYFRWWTFRKHIKNTPDGFIITEFLPDVPWSGKYNAINCPAGHQIYEGRWLHDPVYINDYINFWLSHAGEDVRRYSFWIANSTFEFQKVHPDAKVLKSQFQHLVANYEAWEDTRRDKGETLFWTIDDRDGMEMSVGGRLIREQSASLESLRPTLNSYMYGDALALSEIASTFTLKKEATRFAEKAQSIKKSVQNQLWSGELNFFTVLPRNYSDDTTPINVRENIGYVPWYFNLPDDRMVYSNAWQQVLDTTGFAAPIGLTVCERRHPYFDVSYEGHECQWNGPSWPFATTQILKGLSNLLNNYQHNGGLDKGDYYTLLQQFARAHYIIEDDGKKQNWIDENLNPFTGDWISRTRLKTYENGTWSDKKGGEERGKDYNHSGFCDLVISDLIGIKPRVDNTLEISPLIPEDWDWFALDRVKYHDKIISVVWDRTGGRYGLGKGFTVSVDGIEKHNSSKIVDLRIKL